MYFSKAGQVALLRGHDHEAPVGKLGEVLLVGFVGAELQGHIRTRIYDNLLRQPAYNGLGFDQYYLPNSDYIAENTFWIGVWPGITDMMIDYMAEVLHGFIKQR